MVRKGEEGGKGETSDEGATAFDEQRAFFGR